MSRTSSHTLRTSTSPQQHAPAVPVFVAIISGIVADWYLNLPVWLWIWPAALLAILWMISFTRNLQRIATACLLLACSLTGGAAHHFHWSLVSETELMAYATDEPRPLRLRAFVEKRPVVTPAGPASHLSALPPRDRSVATLQAIALIAPDGFDTLIPVSGNVRLDVQGALPDLASGTEVEVWGSLVLPSNIKNPGGFDFRTFLRERGIHTIVRCDFPECVQVRSTPTARWLPDLSEWQATIADRLRHRLSPTNGALAVALLLGPRTGISEEMKQAFLQSGTVHFLAISGINVAILVLFLWPLVRLIPVPRSIHLAIVGLAVGGYVLLTDADAPVVRAAILVWASLLSLVGGRATVPMNLLASAALIILVRNPHDLFQVGAQLSFLAILALHCLVSFRWVFSPAKVDPFTEVTQSWWQPLARKVGRGIRAAFLTTCMVWVFTTPLVLARFHLVSPIGFLVNIILPLWVTITLWVGYVCLLASIVCTPVLDFISPLFDVCLSGFAGAVHYASQTPWGHFKVVGPPDAWLAIFYLLIMTAGSGLLHKFWQAWIWRSVLLWCVGGLIWGAVPEPPRGIRCTFLSVGHGAAILIEVPNGQTILYDGGSLENADRARQAIESALIARGKVRLDAVMISHADVDHFNAIHGLLESLPVGQIFVSPTFFDFHQAAVVDLHQAALKAAVPMRLVWADDHLKSDPLVELQILQPPAQGAGIDDNSNSLVLSVRYAGHGLLLTGDLEKSGLDALLRLSPHPHDILLAPHHGSLKANPPDLARWANPRWLVVSGGADTAFDKLQAQYGDGVTMLSTALQGAVTIEITPQGAMTVTTQLTTRQKPM